MIKIVEGNILNATENVIAHQTNCFGIMGGGLALQIKNKYPQVYKEYKEYCNKHKETEYCLGTYQIIPVGYNKYICNLFGQYGYGRDKQYTDYMALEFSLIGLYKFALEHNLSVAIPYNLGCGLAGGDWNIVYKIIEDVFQDYDVTIYKFNK